MGNEYSEGINAQDLVDNGVQFASRGRRVFSDVSALPDGEITTSLHNAITWENDEEDGHRNQIRYPRKRESHRMKKINIRRWAGLGTT